MKKIDKTSEKYDAYATILAGIFGFGSTLIVNSITNTIIGTTVHSNGSNINGMTKAAMHLGKIGIGTVTMYSVTSTMRNEIDNYVDLINGTIDVFNAYYDNHSENENKESVTA